MGEGVGDGCDREGAGNAVALGNRVEKGQTCAKGSREGSSEKVTLPLARLKCLYANARSLGNKREESEAPAQLENRELVAMAETWWDDLQDRSTTVEVVQASQKRQAGKEGRGSRPLC